MSIDDLFYQKAELEKRIKDLHAQLEVISVEIEQVKLPELLNSGVLQNLSWSYAGHAPVCWVAIRCDIEEVPDNLVGLLLYNDNRIPLAEGMLLLLYPDVAEVAIEFRKESNFLQHGKGFKIACETLESDLNFSENRAGELASILDRINRNK